MSRLNWKGYISFGLVSIPILLYSAQKEKSNISFHHIDKRNNARIKYQRINTLTGKAVSWENIIRGYEYDKKKLIPVPDNVLKKVAGENSKIIDIQSFIDKNEFNILLVDKNYYLVPNEKEKGDKGYVILREALKETNKIGIAKVIISTKEYISAIIPYENALILCLLKYDNEIKKPFEFPLPNKSIGYYKVNKKEIYIAKQLIKSMYSKWKPEKYIDEYQTAIHKWVVETVNKLPHPKIKRRKLTATNVINFIDLLKKSLPKKSKSVAHKKRNIL